MEEETPDYEELSKASVALMEQRLQLHESNMRNVASHLLGGLLIYEGSSISVIISELVDKNNELKAEYRRLVNVELEKHAELAKQRVSARASSGTSEDELHAPDEEIRRITPVMVFVVVKLQDIQL
jgi:hypothetical protein